VAIRLKADDFEAGHRLIVSSEFYYWFRLEVASDGRLVVRLSSSSSAPTPERIEAGRWTTVVCGIDVKEGRGVVACDGRPAQTFSVPPRASARTSHDEHLTRWTFANPQVKQVVHGLVDEFIVYDRLLTPEECARVPIGPEATSLRKSRHPVTPPRDLAAEAKARLAARGPGPARLISAFRFDQDARDELKLPARAAGRSNVTFRDGAMEFNGRVPSPGASSVVIQSAPMPLRTFSFAIRFKPDPSLENGGYGYTVLRSDAGGQLRLTVESEGRLALNVAGKRVWISSERFNPTVWTTVACGVDLDREALTAYINGRKTAEESLPLSLEPRREELAPQYWYFDSDRQKSFHGLIDELLIFDRMLTPEEFARLQWTRRQ